MPIDLVLEVKFFTDPFLQIPRSVGLRWMSFFSWMKLFHFPVWQEGSISRNLWSMEPYFVQHLLFSKLCPDAVKFDVTVFSTGMENIWGVNGVLQLRFLGLLFDKSDLFNLVQFWYQEYKKFAYTYLTRANTRFRVMACCISLSLCMCV